MMIRLIHGRIADLSVANVVVDTGGVGYLIHTNARTEALRLDDNVSFYTHLAVRENALDLYGFQTHDELVVFELLLTIPKIGPKTALQIMCQASIDLIKEAARRDDAGHLSKLSGIGKKSAEKIVAGLKDKLSPEDDSFAEAGDTVSVSYAHDTIDALIALGYREDESRRAVRKLAETHPNITTSTAALKATLKLLSR